MSITGAIAGTNQSGKTSTSGASSNRSTLNANDFIKLMITQLQNQDPTNPAKSSELLSQVSQIGQLQSSTQLQTAITGIVTQSQIGSAGNLIGKAVQGVDDQNNNVQGVVDSVRVSQNQVFLELHTGKELQLGKVTMIGNGPAATAPTIPPATTAAA